MIVTKKKLRILLTSGEPAGIGPDLIIKLAQINHNQALTVIADPELLKQRAQQLCLPLDINLVSDHKTPDIVSDIKSLNVIPIKLKAPCLPGKLDPHNADYVLEMLDIASRECLAKHYAAVVTTPIQKSVINDAGIKFSGHTEYFSERCENTLPVMLLSCPDLRVALVTTHLALRDVPDAITHDRVESTIRIVINDMKHRFGISHPRIIVCGLNPHAGEGGHLGSEDMNIISPIINDFISQGYAVTGPLPADTAFRLEIRQKTDVFICMYHDQGLPVLKTLGFGEAVNITLGLPIIRTSVDHGTALDLAGTGKANCDSLLAAIDIAIELAQHEANMLDINNATDGC